MDSDDPYTEPHTSADKGKQRASTPEPSERTPLLPSNSSYTVRQSRPRFSPPEQPPHQNLLRKLLIVFLATLLACVVVLALIVAFALSYSSRISNLTVQDILDRGFIIEGPDRIEVLNATKEDGVWIRVDARVGLDIGSVLEILPRDEDLIWTELWKGLGRWGARKVGTISIQLSQITVTSSGKPLPILAELTAPTMELPLSPEPPAGLDWLTPMSIPIKIHPTERTEDLVHFANESWMSGTVRVSGTVPSVRVMGGKFGHHTWRDSLNVERSNFSVAISTKSELVHPTSPSTPIQQFPVPQLPGLPNSGKNTPFPPFSQLVTLKTFRIFSDFPQLLVDASATFPSPIPTSMELTVPSLPLIISVPLYQNGTLAGHTPPVVHVETEPLTLTYPNTTIYIHGQIAALTHESFPSLSGFLTTYLKGESPTISLSSPLLPGITLDTVFPAPDHRPQVLRNVTIKDMKIRPLTSGTMLASGIVFANIVLPRGMDVSLQVNAVYPQLLVYDGPVPDGEPVGTEALPSENEDDGLPDPVPLPNPLPSNAFAHIRPEEWLGSISVPLEHGGEEGSILAISAKIVDVPLEVLPGRQREFSNFVGKVPRIAILSHLLSNYNLLGRFWW